MLVKTTYRNGPPLPPVSLCRLSPTCDVVQRKQYFFERQHRASEQPRVQHTLRSKYEWRPRGICLRHVSILPVTSSHAAKPRPFRENPSLTIGGMTPSSPSAYTRSISVSQPTQRIRTHSVGCPGGVVVNLEAMSSRAQISSLALEDFGTRPTSTAWRHCRPTNKRVSIRARMIFSRCR